MMNGSDHQPMGLTIEFNVWNNISKQRIQAKNKLIFKKGVYDQKKKKLSTLTIN